MIRLVQLITIQFQSFQIIIIAHLGDCYHEGQGVVQNYTKAFECYEKASKYGCSDVICNIGIIIIIIIIAILMDHALNQIIRKLLIYLIKHLNLVVLIQLVLLYFIIALH